MEVVGVWLRMEEEEGERGDGGEGGGGGKGGWWRRRSGW